MPKRLASVSWKQNKQPKRYCSTSRIRQRRNFAQAEDRYHAVLGWIVDLIILGSLLSGTLAFAIIGGISRSIKTLDQVTTSLADGDLRARV